MPEISVVAPVFNEQESLIDFHLRVCKALAGEDYEIVLVDDGSTDASGDIIGRLAAEDQRVRSLSLSRNFGHQAALTAGLDHARGAAVVTIDADLQDPPEVIPQLIAAWRAGAEVVHGLRHVRPGESRLRLAMIRWFYKLFARIGGLDTFPGNSGDFRLIGGQALTALRALSERTRFLRGLASWIGFRQEVVSYERDPRFAGESKYGFLALLRLAADAIISFSTLPLRLATAAGSVFSLLAFAAIPVVAILKLLGLYEVTGIASVHILVLLIGGIQLVFLGVIGEYLARNYDESKARPIYILRDPA